MFRNILSQILYYLRPSRLLNGLGDILSAWRRSEIREKGIFVLVFLPMFICAAGLVFSVVSFVLFVLPSFVIRVIGWAALTMVFGSGGVYCYERLTGRRPQNPTADFVDTTWTEAGSRGGAQDSQDRPGEAEDRKKWFDDFRKSWWKK